MFEPVDIGFIVAKGMDFVLMLF